MIWNAPARVTAGSRWKKNVEKGSVESTYKVPTSHYHTKHRTDGRCHRGRVARWTNTPARIFKDPAPTPRPSHTTSIGPRAGSSYNWPPRAPEQVRPVPRARPLEDMKSTLIVD